MKAYAEEIAQFKADFYAGMEGLKEMGIPITQEHVMKAVQDDIRQLTIKLNGMREPDWSHEDRIAELALRELAEELTRPAPRPPALAAMTADSDIIDPTTGEVIAKAGQLLDDEVLYRMEHVGIYIEREAQARRCPHYGAEVPIDFVGCAECLIALECFRVYEQAQADQAKCEQIEETLAA